MVELIPYIKDPRKRKGSIINIPKHSRYDPIQDMKRQDQERDRLSCALMKQERAERKARDTESWAQLERILKGD